MSDKMSFPTEIVELPSKGLLYPKDNPLSSGKVKMKYMTSKEEDILTNTNYIQRGIVLDKLIEALIVDDVDYNDLFLFDKDGLLIAARILGYGKNYPFKIYKNNNPSDFKQVNVDLTTLQHKEIDEELFKEGLNEFNYTLPHSNTSITFKFLNGHDSKNIDKEITSLKKLFKDKVGEGTVRLKHIITSVNGDDSKKAINEFVDNYLLAMDIRELRNYIKNIQPGVITKTTITDEDGLEEEVNIPIGIDFFWPDVEL